MDDQPRRPGTEPDYRFSLANERTLLAWARTALALDAAGLGVVRFAPPLGVPGAREAIGTALVLLGVVTAWTGYRRWIGVGRAIRTGEPLPGSRVPLLLTAGLAILSLALTVLVVAGALSEG
jgi:inner membrane protein YidH